MPTRAFAPTPKFAVPTTLDSPSVHCRPKPAFPVTVPMGAEADKADPRATRMPSPVPGTVATLLVIVLDRIWIVDRVVASTPKPTFWLTITSRIDAEDPRKREMPASWVGFPLPVMVLTVVSPNLASPTSADAMRRLIPEPELPEIVFPPTMSALPFEILIPLPVVSTVPLPEIWLIPTYALALNT